MTKIDKSTHWGIEGTLSHETGDVIEGDDLDLFIDEFCILTEKHGLRFNGGWVPLTQAQIDGEVE